MNDIINLPESHQVEYKGKMYNWFVGDPVKPELFMESHWAWGIPQDTNGGKWNTINAKLIGEFNYKTRNISNIEELKR